MTITKALIIASVYGLEAEVDDLISQGYTPEDALREWDII